MHSAVSAASYRTFFSAFRSSATITSKLHCTFDFKMYTASVVISAGARVLEQGGHGQFWGAHGERVEREPNGGLGAEPPAGSRGRAPGQEVRGAIRSPPEAESFLALRRATDRANLYPLQYFQQSITIR